MKGGD